MNEQAPSKDLSGPPFTMDRYGSLAACITAERDWLREELAREVGTRAALVAEVDARRKQVEALSIHAEKWVKRALTPAHEREPPHCSTCSCGMPVCETFFVTVEVTDYEQPAAEPGKSLATKLGELLLGRGFYDRLNDLTPDDTPARILAEFLKDAKPIVSQHYGRTPPPPAAPGVVAEEDC